MAALSLEVGLELARTFSRAKNYPRDEAGELALVRGLQRVAPGLEQARAIVERCASLSEYCPTDRDLLTVAADLYPPPPEPAWSMDTRTCPAKKCDGHGWARVFFLVTEERRGEAVFKRRERITFAQYRELSGKVDRKSQRVYESVEPCACKPYVPRPEDDRKARAGGSDR